MKRTTKKYLLSTLALSTAFCGLLGVKAFGAKAEEPNAFDSFAIENEAEVRTEAPVGIRFVTMVNADQLAAAEEFGTLVIPKTLLNGDLEIDTENAAKIVAESWLDEEQSGYTGVIVGAKDGDDFTDLPESFYDDVLVARSYAIVDGEAVYSENVVEQSIAQVAAISLNAGEQSALLQEIVDYVLGQDFAFAQTELSLTVEAEPTEVALESKGLAVEFENSNPEVASYADGKVTALNPGETTITAKIGEKTTSLKVTVDLEAIEGTKLTAWSEDFVSENVAQATDGNGNGACELSYDADTKVLGAGTLEVKSTSGYARFNVSLSSTLPLGMQYEKIVFYVFVDGENQQCGDTLLNSKAWTKVEVAAPATKHLQLTLREIDWNSNGGGVFYVSEIYGVNPVNNVPVIENPVVFDFTEENTATAFSGEMTAEYVNGLAQLTTTVAKNFIDIQFTQSVFLFNYSHIQFAIYAPSDARKIAGRDSTTQMGDAVLLTKNDWLIVTLPLVDTDSTAVVGELNKYILRYLWTGSSANMPLGETFYMTDIYGVEKENKAFAFTEQNTATALSGNFTAEYENGVAKITKTATDWVDVQFTQSVDLSGYTSIQFWAYTSESSRKIAGRTSNAQTVSVELTKGSWKLITISLTNSGGTKANDLKGFVLRYLWANNGGTIPAGEVFSISDIYGVK